jgi:Tfp pilus assembly protein FimT
MRAKCFDLYPPVKRRPGFSLTELVVAVAVAMILMAVGLPAFVRAYHSYQLSNAAQQVAGILRQTRYEAIRLNKTVNCIIQPSGTYPGLTNFWADSNGNGLLDPTEKMILLGTSGSGNLVDSGGVPNTGSLLSQAVNSIATTPASPGGATIAFNARGAVTSPTNVNVFYLASPVAPEAGYRAVIMTPAGAIQIWTADAAGNWQQQR